MNMENVILQSIQILGLSNEVKLKVEPALGDYEKVYMIVDSVTGTVLYGTHDGGRAGTWLDGFSTARNRARG